MKLDDQILYLGRWVSREHFRAFVFNSTGQKLANSYEEFSEMISSGVWFTEPNDVHPDNVVDIKPKRGRPCQSPNKASEVL